MGFNGWYVGLMGLDGSGGGGGLDGWMMSDQPTDDGRMTYCPRPPKQLSKHY